MPADYLLSDEFFLQFPTNNIFSLPLLLLLLEDSENFSTKLLKSRHSVALSFYLKFRQNVYFLFNQDIELCKIWVVLLKTRSILFE